MVNDILWGMEKQEITMVIILDLCAAFNTVDHDVLLSILEKQFGFCKGALEWFHNSKIHNTKILQGLYRW